MKRLLLALAVASPGAFAQVWQSADEIRDGVANIYEQQSGVNWSDDDWENMHNAMSDMFVDIHNFSLHRHEADVCVGGDRNSDIPLSCSPHPDNISVTTLVDSIEDVTDVFLEDFIGDATDPLSLNDDGDMIVGDFGMLEDEMQAVADVYNEHFGSESDFDTLVLQDRLDEFEADMETPLDEYNDLAGTVSGGWANSLTGVINSNMQEDGNLFDGGDGDAYRVDFGTDDELDDRHTIAFSDHDDSLVEYGSSHAYTVDLPQYASTHEITISKGGFQHKGTYDFPDWIGVVQVQGGESIRLVTTQGTYYVAREDGEWQIQDALQNKIEFYGIDPDGDLQSSIDGFSKYMISECRDGDDFTDCDY